MFVPCEARLFLFLDLQYIYDFIVLFFSQLQDLYSIFFIYFDIYSLKFLSCFTILKRLLNIFSFILIRACFLTFNLQDISSIHYFISLIHFDH